MPTSKVAYVAHVPGHKNSKGEAAPWVIKDHHKDDHIISSHKTESEAKSHLQDMHAHAGSLKADAISRDSLDNFTRAYIEAALWSSTDDEGNPLDGKYDIEDLSPATLEAMVQDCKQFQQQNDEALQERGDTQGGHDFWLTRNGHGSGFWDGDWPENGKALTLASKKYGEADLYVGDDGYIYQYGKEDSAPIPPREEYNPTPEELADLKSMGIIGSSKTAIYVEEQWEDILRKLGFVVDQSTETAWEDTLYINPEMPGLQVTIHEAGESFYVVEKDGEVIEQGNESDRLWEALNQSFEAEPVEHNREFTDEDRALMQQMGVTAHKKSKLLDKPLPKVATEFEPQTDRQYDYEANGNDVVLISPANVTKLLQDGEATNFWISLDQIENETMEATQQEYLKRVRELVRSYFDAEAKAASKRCVIQVDATKLKKGSVTFVSGVEYKEGKVDRLKFTSKREKAKMFSQLIAAKVVAQLPEFKLTGSIKG